MSLESTIRRVLTNKQAPQEITEAVKPEDKGEYDQEGDMAKTQLRGVMKDAEHMIKMFGDDDNLPEWVQAKIIKAADYLKSAHDYMMNKDESVNEEWVCGKCNCDPCTCEGEGLEEKTSEMDEKFANPAQQAAVMAKMKKDGKYKKEAYNEPQGQAKRMMSPLHKARMDKEKADRDRDGKLKPGIVKVRKEEAELEEAKKVSSMQIHKVLAPTKNSREGIAALKKAFRVNDMEAKKMLDRVMNEETIDEISRSMTPMSKRFGKAVDAKKFDVYKKHIKQHRVDEPTVRMIIDNPNDAESKRMMKNKNIAKAVDLRKAAMKESVQIDEAKFTPKEIKMAIGIASDPRYKGGNMTGAAKAINKIKKGLSDYPQVAAVLKRQNESIEEAKKPDDTVNIRQSLKKAIDMRGQKEIVFKDGSKAKISVQDAEKAMKMLDNTRMAKAKQDLTIRMMKSHQDFKDALAGKKPKVDPFALRVKTNEATVDTADIAKHKMISKDDKDKLGSVAKMMNREKAKRHMDLAKKARAEGDYDKANYHTQLARQMQSEGTFISKFKEELKEKKRGMSETKGAPKGYHFTRSGQLKKGDAGQDGPGGKMLRSDPLDKLRKKIPPLPENDK